MSEYQSRKICLDTRAERYVWLQDLKDMSGYRSWNTCPETRATARGLELQGTLPVEESVPSFLTAVSLSPAGNKGLLPKDYPAVAECCQWLLH